MLIDAGLHLAGAHTPLAVLLFIETLLYFTVLTSILTNKNALSHSNLGSGRNKSPWYHLNSGSVFSACTRPFNARGTPDANALTERFTPETLGRPFHILHRSFHRPLRLLAGWSVYFLPFLVFMRYWFYYRESGMDCQVFTQIFPSVEKKNRKLRTSHHFVTHP